jgi:hypothetical protein
VDQDADEMDLILRCVTYGGESEGYEGYWQIRVRLRIPPAGASVTYGPEENGENKGGTQGCLFRRSVMVFGRFDKKMEAAIDEIFGSIRISSLEETIS